MNRAVHDELVAARQGKTGTIRRRHVIYVEGYDPRGAKGYFDLFRRSCERFQELWPVSLTLQPPEIESEDFAHWHVNAQGPNWRVATRYEFVRMERHIRSDMARPTAQQALSALGWYADDVLSGAQFRIFGASWRFAMHLLSFQLLALAWAAAAAIVGAAVGYALTKYLGLPAPLSVIVALAAACVALVGLGPLARRWRLTQIGSCWSTLRRFGRGHPTWVDNVVEAGAKRVVAAARANEADELVLIGHSTGGAIAVAIMARALELDPYLGNIGSRVVLLTLGSVMPAVALHPAAQRMRAMVDRLASATNFAWIDCQSRKDIMCFANFDPVEGIGVHIGAKRCNPSMWRISFKDTIAAEGYSRFRWNFFRVHYQYIMGGDRPAPYDYILLVSGPMPIAQWPKRDREFMATLLQDAAPPGEHHHDALIGV
jgi:pimeloyl-ACP methyl ester carboxylesterase